MVPKFCEVIPSTLTAIDVVLEKLIGVVKGLPCAPDEIADVDHVHSHAALSGRSKNPESREECKVPKRSKVVLKNYPLRCSGRYAYGDDHLGGGITLRQLRDLRGDALVEEVLELVRKHRPVQISFIGAGLHWLHEKPLRMGLKVGHLIDLSLAVGRRFAR